MLARSSNPAGQRVDRGQGRGERDLIAERRSPWFRAFFSWHVRRRLQRSFTEVRVRGLEEVADAATRGPLLLLGNHTSWWDGLLAFHLLATELRLDATALMDANNLRRVPFLARIGGFGVELDDPRDVLRGLRHAASRLDAPGRVVVVFPQGRERPVTSRPLGFRPGAAHLARMAPAARVVSFALRYEMGADERATVHASFAVGDAGAAAAIAAESRVTSLLDALDAALCAEDVSAWRALWPRPARFPLPERVLAMLLRG